MWKKILPGVGAVLLIVGLAGWLRPRSRGPADSSGPGFATVRSRVEWMEGRIRGRVPSKILDAQFKQWENQIPAGHMGPAYTMRFLRAKITISPADAPKWAARTQPMRSTRYATGAAANFLYEMTAADGSGARFYDPKPLFGSADGGFMTITENNRYVFVAIRY